MPSHTVAVILAAGRGTRLKTKTKNKVAYNLNGKPMVWYSYRNVCRSGIQDIYVIVGFAKDSVISALGDQVTYITQPHPQGTGHALICALKAIPAHTQNLLVLSGDDSAFYPPQMIEQLIHTHQQQNSAITLLTLQLADPTGLGRIQRRAGRIIGVIEDKNCTPSQKRITEINTGLYCFSYPFINHYLRQIKKDPVSQEYYLTDIVAIAHRTGHHITGFTWPDAAVWWGVNTRSQLNEAKVRMTRHKLSR